MSQNLGSLPPLSHNVTLRRPPPSPLTCDVIYGLPLSLIVDVDDKLTQYKINWREHVQRMDDHKLLKKI